MGEKKTNTCLDLLEILYHETDEEHILNAQALADRIGCGRKTIYSNVETLRSYGFDIRQKKGSSFGYYINNRRFDTGELKFLTDAVVGSQCLSAKKSEELLKKISSLTSDSRAKELRKNSTPERRIKTNNPDTCSTIAVIQKCIARNRRVAFQYCDITLKQDLVPKKNGAFYEVSPYSLSLYDGSYYLVGFDEREQKTERFRLDRMIHVSESKHTRSSRRPHGKSGYPDYPVKPLSIVLGSEESSVCISGPLDSAGIIFDRFGTDIFIRPDNDRFVAHISASVSPSFFGWFAGLGPEFRIEGPANVRLQYTDYIRSIEQAYLRA